MSPSHYIWQQKDWPTLTWKSDTILKVLGRARRSQGEILANADFIGLKAQADLVVEEAFTTAAIEGENLDRQTIRSSVAQRLGLPTAGLPPQQRHVDGLVEMLLDAATNYYHDLTATRLDGWHASLFPTGFSGMQKILAGACRKSNEPMQVVSGPVGREKVHYEAPPAKNLEKEMKTFLNWWNAPPKGLDGLIRAGVAHFWFVTIHPYEDGNGRIARAITDMALAQDEQTNRRVYSLSSQIVKEKEQYYEALETSQKAKCDISAWLKWFLLMFTRAVESSQEIVQKALFMAKFWQIHGRVELSERQAKVIQRLLEAEPQGFEGGLTNRKYVSLTKVSRETAKRDLADLERRGLIKRNRAKGRSVSYALKKDIPGLAKGL